MRAFCGLKWTLASGTHGFDVVDMPDGDRLAWMQEAMRRNGSLNDEIGLRGEDSVLTFSERHQYAETLQSLGSIPFRRVALVDTLAPWVIFCKAKGWLSGKLLLQERDRDLMQIEDRWVMCEKRSRAAGYQCLPMELLE